MSSQADFDDSSLRDLIGEWGRQELASPAARRRVLVVLSRKPKTEDIKAELPNSEGSKHIVMFESVSEEFEGSEDYVAVVHKLYNKAYYGFPDYNVKADIWGLFTSTGNNVFKLRPMSMLRTDDSPSLDLLEDITDTRYYFDKQRRKMARIEETDDDEGEEAAETVHKDPPPPKEVSEMFEALKQNVENAGFDKSIATFVKAYVKKLFKAIDKFHATYDDPEILFGSLMKDNFSYTERRLRKQTAGLEKNRMDFLIQIVKSTDDNMKGLTESQQESMEKVTQVLACFLASFHPDEAKRNTMPECTSAKLNLSTKDLRKLF